MTNYKELKNFLVKNLVTQDPYFAGVQASLLNQAEILLLEQNHNKNQNVESYARQIKDLVEVAGHPEHFRGISMLVDAYFDDKAIPNNNGQHV